MDAWRRWQDWGTLILGVLLFISPFAFRVLSHTVVAWTAVVFAVLMVLAALWALYRPEQRLAHWTTMALGVLLFISPWVIGFATLSYMGWSAWIIGVLAFLLAGSTALTGRRQMQKA